jgi:glycerol-3-phosphate dehydrogenase subunit C
VQEKVTGISARVPPAALRERAVRAVVRAAHAAKKARVSAGEVVLFATCYGEYNIPSVARAATLVLEHNGLKVYRAGDAFEGQPALSMCCGLPNLDGGDVEAFQKKVKDNVASMLPHVRAGRRIAVIGPSCGYTMKREWYEYVPLPEVKEVMEATVDLMELLVTLGRAKTLKREFPRRAWARSRITRPVTCARRRSASPGCAFCSKWCRTPRSRWWRSARPSTAPGA